MIYVAALRAYIYDEVRHFLFVVPSLFCLLGITSPGTRSSDQRLTVFTVTSDFVRSCQNPVLILPDEVPRAPLRRRHGMRNAVERTERANSASRAPNSF